MRSPHPRPWHSASVFGDGPRRPLDRNQRARFRYLLNAHRRARRLTRAALDVGLALLHRLGEDGQLDPSHDTLAMDAGCSDRTVRRAIGALRGLGLLSWTLRLVRNGWRTEQTSNAYVLVADAAAPVLPTQRCAGHSGRQTNSVEIQLQVRPADEVRAAREALARRRAAFAQMQMALKGRRAATAATAA